MYGLDHIGVVVRDLNHSTTVLSRLWGMGPWQFAKHETENIDSGAGKSLKLGLSFADLGSGLRIELVQPIEGQSIWSDYLDRKGEGLHHICLCIPTIKWDTTVLRLEENRHRLISSTIFQGKRSNYYDPGIGNILIQIEEKIKI